MKTKTSLVFVLLVLLVALAACDLDTSIPTSAPSRPTLPPDTTAPPAPTAPDAPAPGDRTIRVADGMTMVYVPAGSFAMGTSEKDVAALLEACAMCDEAWLRTEQPQHLVQLSEFWIDQTEVSNAQYARCVQGGGCPALGPEYQQDVRLNDPQQPVVGVSWSAAAAYCSWVGARLPTEAEWEYAARGPGGHSYPWGNAFDGARLNFCDANCLEELPDLRFNDGYPYSAPVGSYPGGASWVGAVDMAGNVWEWTGDRYDAGYYSYSPQKDPTGPLTGAFHVLKGGAYYNDNFWARPAARAGNNVDPNAGDVGIGFRCVVAPAVVGY